jgi:hypothetical protein
MVHHAQLPCCNAGAAAADGQNRPNAAELAQAKLANSPYLPLRNLRCDDHEGVLAVRGQVPTYYLKQLAQTVVRDIPGVEVINNQVLVVRLEARRFPPDSLAEIDGRTCRT